MFLEGRPSGVLTSFFLLTCHLHTLLHFTHLLGEHLVHESLVGRSSILQPKWHDFIGKKPLACDERSLLLTRLV